MVIRFALFKRPSDFETSVAHETRCRMHGHVTPCASCRLQVANGVSVICSRLLCDDSIQEAYLTTPSCKWWETSKGWDGKRCCHDGPTTTGYHQRLDSGRHVGLRNINLKGAKSWQQSRIRCNLEPEAEATKSLVLDRGLEHSTFINPDLWYRLPAYDLSDPVQYGEVPVTISIMHPFSVPWTWYTPYSTKPHGFRKPGSP